MIGQLIVIDGTDGSGKKTQSKLLIEHFKKEGRSAIYFDFPRHGMPSAAMVDEYLNGAFGSAGEVNPYAASIFYAIDRFAAAPEIRKVLADGDIAVCDRYVSANMGHQAGKIHDLEKREKYLEWLENLEFGPIFNIPRPDINILLYVPTIIGQQLVDKKDQRKYLGEKKRDIHEDDKTHLDDAASAFLYVAKKYNWIVIQCAPNNVMLSIEEIHEMIWDKVKHLV
jgi:dTMP kinase